LDRAVRVFRHNFRPNDQLPGGLHGFNAITRSCEVTDDDSHGTYTAGIVGASGNNAHTATGVSRIANLMALKFLNNRGFGTTADAIAAIEFAIQVKKKFPATANIRVLNASFGGDSFSQALLDEINLAGANDMLLVAAAGNDNRDVDSFPIIPRATTHRTY
jgi:subtilisin family serine protease